MNVLETLNYLVKKANAKLEENKYDRIRELERKIIVKFQENGCYVTHLAGGKLEEFKMASEDEKADIEIQLSIETLKDLVEERLDAVSAYITGKIKIRAKLMDKILLAEVLKG